MFYTKIRGKERLPKELVHYARRRIDLPADELSKELEVTQEAVGFILFYTQVF
jgi:hypothetical protein